VHFPKKETLIWNIEERGSDVNIACRMLIDAYEDRCEQIILISNDSDLLSPIKIVKKLKKRVALILPIAKREHTASKVLSDEAHIVRKVNFAHLRKSQLPEKIAHTISKPPEWNSRIIEKKKSV